MIDIVETLEHWYAGRPKAQVADSLGVDRKTVRRYVARAEEAGLVPGGPPVTTEAWAHGVEAELELGNDPEVSARAADPPEQIGVLVLVRLHEGPIGSDHVHGQELIDRQPVLPHEPSDAPAEGEP